MLGAGRSDRGANRHCLGLEIAELTHDDDHVGIPRSTRLSASVDFELHAFERVLNCLGLARIRLRLYIT